MTRVLLPATLPELWEALAASPGAPLLAGGTDLLVRLRARRQRPEALVGLERLAELRTIRRQGRSLRIGALATHAMIAGHPLVLRHAPVLARAVSEVGGPAIRNMGTLGGNLCTASPAGDSLPALAVLEARVELLSAGGTRLLPLSGFLLGPGRTALAPGEIVGAVRVPLAADFQVQHFEKVGRRAALAIAVVSLAVLARLEKGVVAEARLAVGSAAPTVLRCPEAEELLRGGRLTLSALERAAKAVRAAVRPIDDARASAGYRRQVAGNLLLRLADL
ncbi:MAG: xanthine dehydrogenase family protein subunit M [Desulfovibrio aminophilus]|uniref:FAD binding domain-containing protein n=1 Tax=Desulfovibrio aminophilus TaxID=81425 RepID=UPI0039E75146